MHPLRALLDIYLRCKNQRKHLKNSSVAIQEDIERSDDTLENIKALSDAAPDIEERKRDLEVVL